MTPLIPRRVWHAILAGALVVVFAVFLILPIWIVVADGFSRPGGGFTLAYVRMIFEDSSLVRGLTNATLIAFATTALALAIALPLAILSVRYEFPGRRWLSGLLLAPLILPPFVGAMGIRLVLGRFGPLTMLLARHAALGVDWLGRYRVAGIIVVEALHLYPVLLLNLQATLANIDPALEQAAANLGAGRWMVLRRITLPLLRPGLFAGCTLTLIWSFTELGTPLMFDFNTITPVQIFRQITDVAGNPLPFALVVVTLAVSAGLYVVGKLLLGKTHEAMAGKATTAAMPRRLSGWKSAAAFSIFGGVIALAILPHLAVVLTSFTATGAWYRSVLPQSLTMSHYGQALIDDLAVPSVVNSIKYALLATALAMVVGMSVAVVVVRSDLPGRGLIDGLAMAPLAVPGLVLAFGYLAISVSLKLRLGAAAPKWLDVQESPLVLLVIAYAMRRLPYVVRAAVAGLRQTPRDLELAAGNLGASAWMVLRRITAPLIAAHLIAGALLAFALAMLEVSDSLILAQRAEYFPITRAILELSQRLGDGLYIASALGVWAMILLGLTLLAANGLIGRKIGAMFRV